MRTFIQILARHHSAFAQGLLVTLKLVLLVWSAGIIGGGALGICAAKLKNLVGIPVRVASFVLSGIPILVFLFWAHYPLQAILGVVIDPFYTATVVLAIVNIFAVSDLVSNHVSEFPEQYNVAAKVCGLSLRTTIFRIQIPIVFRQIVPALLPLQVMMLHATLFASLISVEETFRMAQRVNSVEYKPIQIYSALALFFLTVSLPVNGLAIWLRSRLTRNISER